MNESLLPVNSSDLEKNIELLIKRAAEVNVDFSKLWNLEKCPTEYLPWLAWALSVDEWDNGWDEQTKRNVIRESIKVHRQKGTIGALKKALAATDVDIQIEEWFNYEDEAERVPGTFRANVYSRSRGINESEYNNIKQIIEKTKNARSQYDLRLYLANESTTPYVGVAAQSGNTTTVYPFIIKNIESNLCYSIASGYQSVNTITIYPKGYAPVV
ncbi:phage tail protein I [Endozoicomonas sp. SM1973]|uniref:Phage tail protein I n=1 Tax=Spartinivicinus marinus TaxID=2994442 RepID=A0A853HRM2_9GAMM|nr:phage tail protein I [Spartinivicinus marinus]MCX4026616.1 phage tail protein I [Spartinivicinus marinus]NYZ64450.1 phage tail protein I [Spartinivicinus marinus]